MHARVTAEELREQIVREMIALGLLEEGTVIRQSTGVGNLPEIPEE
jgi:hypothetical protein